MNKLIENKYPLIHSNSVQTYSMPRAGFDEMLSSISSARETIYFAGYCFAPGRLFNEFEEKLIAAVKRGVLTYVLADYHGSSKIAQSTINRLVKHGVIWIFYRPFNLQNAIKYDLRLHKKLLIVDNKIGFTGGLGIYDVWIKSVDIYPLSWLDTHFKIEGPVVDEMQKSFIESWNKFSPAEYMLAFNPEASKESGEIAISSINSPPAIKSSKVGNLYLDMIDCAQESIYITTAYFGPTKNLRNALINAAKRGVKVSLILNGKYNTHTFAAEAGRRWYKHLIAAGVGIFEYQPTKIHSKLLTIDGNYTSIGSGNMNFRSFHSDSEHNLLIKDRGISHQIVNEFNINLKHCHKISMQDINDVGILRKIYRFILSLPRILY